MADPETLCAAMNQIIRSGDVAIEQAAKVGSGPEEVYSFAFYQDTIFGK